MTRRARNIKSSLFVLAISSLLIAPIAHAQSETVRATLTKLPQFTVSVIRPNDGSVNGDNSGFSFNNAGFIATNITPQILLRIAFDIEDNQILEAPAWIKSERFDLQGKVDPSEADTLKSLQNEQRTQMLQPLLEDRFKLKSHFETRELPIYSLVVLKTGPKLKEIEPEVGPEKGKKDRGANWGNNEVKSTGIAIDKLAHILTQTLERTVVNKTGLPGSYEFDLKWAPDDSSTHADSGPSLFTAIQEQLGLKLESGKGPVQVLIIDHIEHPSEN